jgi:hypothetical protein
MKVDGLSLVWPQNNGDSLPVVWPQNHWDGLSAIWPQNHWDGFSRFGLKTGGGGFLPSLDSKPVASGFPVWASKLTVTVW